MAEKGELRRYTLKYREEVKELAVWLGTPAADIEHAVRRVFAMPLLHPAPALLFHSEDGALLCVLSSHAPTGTVLRVSLRTAGDGGAPAEAGQNGAGGSWAALGVHADELRWDRFRLPDGTLPRHLESNYMFGDQRARDCRAAGKPFVDTEPASLEVPEAPRPQQISFCMCTEEETAELELELIRLADDRERKNKAVAEVLAQVRVWRRPLLYAGITAALFPAREDANDLLHVRPPGLPPPPWLPGHMPLFTRGVFNDTFFALALSVVATCPQQLANVFVSCENSDVGMYTCQFSMDDATFAETGWRCVTIDDSIPCGASLRPVLLATESPDELWPALLHKAYAKFVGSYSHLHVGDTAQVLRHITGRYPDVVEWDAGQLRKRHLNILWWRLGEASRLGLPTVAMRRHETCPLVRDVFTADTRRSTSRKGPRPKVGELRIVPWHCHLNWDNGVLVSLVADVPIGRDTELLLKLRDMYGGIDWAGDWSDQSPLWTKQMRELLGHKTPDDHVMWMRLADFMARYDTLLIQTRYDVVSRRCSPPVCLFRRMDAVDDADSLCLRAHQYFVDVESYDGSAGDADTLGLLIQLSQPCLPEPDPVPGAPPSRGPRPAHVELQMFVRKAPGELVPAEEVPEAEDDGCVHGQRRIFAASEQRVELDEGTCGSQIRAKEGGTLPSGARGDYLLTRNAAVAAGNYVLAVVQQAPGEALEYCLHVSAASPAAGLRFRVSGGGTLDAPALAHDSPLGVPMSPKQRLITSNPAARRSVAQYM